MNRVKQFLYYIAFQEESIITFNASGMVLAIQYDASYLSEINAHSRAGGHHLLSNEEEKTPNNGAVLKISKITRNVLSSTAEAEFRVLFFDAKTTVPMRKTFKEIGHPRPQTTIQTDNKIADVIISNKIAVKATKSIDMKFHWLQYKDNQEQFRYF